MIILIAISAFIITLLGGMFAIRWSDKLHLILGFSAGAMLGVAFFDFLPEAIELAEGRIDAHEILLIVAISFMVYTILDRAFFKHGHSHGHDGHDHSLENASANGLNRGVFGAGSLSAHSFLDGIAVGIAFQVSSAIGAVVAVAVLAHNFSDGLNTVSMILRHGGSKKQALKWLSVDAIAPVLGILSTFFFSIPDSFLGPVLAVFAGFFFYIGASDLLPESHHKHPTYWTTIATVVGLALVYVVVSMAHA